MQEGAQGKGLGCKRGAAVGSKQEVRGLRAGGWGAGGVQGGGSGLAPLTSGVAVACHGAKAPWPLPLPEVDSMSGSSSWGWGGTGRDRRLCCMLSLPVGTTPGQWELLGAVSAAKGSAQSPLPPYGLQGCGASRFQELN